MLMVTTLFIASCAPPAMSEPSVTRTPASSRCRTGQTPEMMLMFESAQWTGDDAVLAHGAQLLVVGVDAVRHEGVVLPQAEFVIRLPVPRAAGAELAHPRDLVRALGEVRLDIEPALAGNLPEFCHELVGAAGG